MPPLPAKRNDLPPDRQASKPDDPNDPSQGESVGEYETFDIIDDDSDIVETVGPDGVPIVTIGQEYEPPQAEGGFYENLAEVLDESILNDIATDILKKIEIDKESRKKADELYEEGMRRTGVGKDAPGGAEFEGASRAVDPTMAEACIDYEARVIKELLPIAGPVKEKLVGAVTREKTQRGKRKKEHMNWQITQQIKGARETMETMLTQVPLSGRQYLHQYWDHRLKRPVWEVVYSDKVYYPYSAPGWHAADRRTIEWSLTAIEFQQRMDSGMYREIDYSQTPVRPEQSKTEKASDKVEGKDDPAENIDGDRTVYETMEIREVTADMAEQLGVEQEGELWPYLISIDLETRKVVSMYRDCEPDDEAREPIEHTYEFQFVPWRGAPVGFPHLIGSLSGAATGALRSLLDAALIATVPTGGVLKGSGTSGQTRRPQPGELIEIEGGVEADDIRKRLMQFSFNPPSPVLFQLLGFLTNAAKGVVRTSLDELATDQTPNTPVGTTMARVEEGLVVFSAVFGRVHSAFNRVLLGLHRLNRLYLPETLRVDHEGKEILVYRQDYEGPCDVIPTSDPTIYSDQQRFAQVIAIQQRAAMVPQLYKGRKVEEEFLKLLKIADPKEWLADAPQPHELNAVNENFSMLKGMPVVAFPEQDHEAHLSVLLDFMEAFGFNPLIATKWLPAAVSHAIEHMGYLYVTVTTELISNAAGVKHAADLMSSDDRVKRRFDQLLAVASRRVIPRVEKLIARAGPLLQKAEATLKQLTPPPPMDPGQAAIQAATAETQRKGVADQADNAVQQRKLALLEQEAADRRAQVAADQATKIQTTTQDNQTALDIASMRLNSGEAPGFSTGESMRGGPATP